MFRKLCLILLTTFLICKTADIISLLQVKQKVSVVCDNETCDNEASGEVEKMGNDDQLLVADHVQFSTSCLAILLTNSFSHPVALHSDMHRNLFSPPPERA